MKGMEGREGERELTWAEALGKEEIENLTGHHSLHLSLLSPLPSLRNLHAHFHSDWP
jgi:hypothetical protein